MQIPLFPRWTRWSLVVFVSAIIVYFSVIKAPSAPSGAGPLFDKQLHFAAYGGLTLVYAYATANYRHQPIRRALGVFLAVVLFGLIVELLQGIVPVRQFSLLDMAANAVGAIIASVWFFLESRLSYRSVETLPIDPSG